MIHSPTSNIVEQYTQAGLILFPCKAYEKDPAKRKTPAEIGYQSTPFNPKLTAKDLPSIYGVLLDDTWFVLDADPRRYSEDGGDKVADLLEMFDIPTPLNTFIVESGSGGRHIYFRCPPGRKYKMYAPGFPAIEVKSLGRYVIGAGSLYDDSGATYRVIRGDLFNVAEAPTALLEYCEQVEATNNDDDEDDSKANQDRFIRYCLSAPASIMGSGGDTTTFKVACKGRDFGLSEQCCFTIMLEYYNEQRCSPRWSENELRTKVRNAYSYAQNSQGSSGISIEPGDLGSDGIAPDPPKRKPGQRARLTVTAWDRVRVQGELTNQLKPTFRNCVNYFLLEDGEIEGAPNPLRDLLGFNKLSQQIEFQRQAPWHEDFKPIWTKEDAIHLKHYFADVRHFSVGVETVEEAAVIAAYDNSFNPLIDWLDSLEWDGKPRLTTWLTAYAGAIDTPYTRAVANITLISAVARAYEPGCKVDTMTVLEGAQGIGKGLMIEILGGQFASSIQLHISNDADYRRTIRKMLGKWIIEVPEMTFTKRQDIEAVKAFMTTRVDNVVLMYDKTNRDLKRTSIFIGTFNPTADGTYLNDATGNRRYLPVTVSNNLKLEQLYVDREQLFAEAVYKYKNGAKWHITNPLILRAAEEEQARRTTKSFYAEQLQEYFDSDAWADDQPITQLFLSKILSIPGSRMDRMQTLKIAQAMRELGFEYKDRRLNGKKVRVWVKCENS